MSNPLLGVVYHWLGGLAAGSFYLPYKAVRRWSWETYWLAGGVFSWLIAPALAATLLAGGFAATLREVPASVLAWSYFWGLMWGIGGLTFGLSLRYLGMSLGYAVTLGYCAVFGTLMPPLFAGTLGATLQTRPGHILVIGMSACGAGIVVAGVAGRRKERELSAGGSGTPSSATEFRFVKGLLVATVSGILSASMAYGLAAAEPIAQAAVARGTAPLWSGLPKLVVVLAGGCTTNAVWCIALNVRNGTWREYFGGAAREPACEDAAMGATDDDDDADLARASARERGGSVTLHVPVSRAGRAAPTFANYLCCAAAGITWYLQFFFYTMGETQMGNYKFSSWTLHMASIIIFSTAWGAALHEWRGTGRGTRAMVAAGVALLILSTIIIGYANSLQAAG